MEKNGIFMTIMTLVVAVIVLGTFALPVINNVNTVEVTEEHEGVYGSNPVQTTEVSRDYSYSEGYLLEDFESHTKTFSTTAPGDDFEGAVTLVYVVSKDYLLNLGLTLLKCFIVYTGEQYEYVWLSEEKKQSNADTFGVTYTITPLSELGFPDAREAETAATITGIDAEYELILVEPYYLSHAYSTYLKSESEGTGVYYYVGYKYYLRFSFTSQIIYLGSTVNKVSTTGEIYARTTTYADVDNIGNAPCKQIPLTFSDGAWKYDGNPVTETYSKTHSEGYVTVLTYSSSDGTSTQICMGDILCPISSTDQMSLFSTVTDFKYYESDRSVAFLKEGVVTYGIPEDVTLSDVSLPEDLVSEYNLKLSGSGGREIKAVSVPSTYTAVFGYADIYTIAEFRGTLPETIHVDVIISSTKGDLVDGQFVESENGSLLKIPSQILTEGTTYNVGADQTYYFGTSDSTTLVENKAPESADVPDTDKPTFTVNSANAGVYDMTFGTDVQGDAFIIIAATCIYDYTETHNEELNPLIGVVAVMLCIGLICMAVAAWSGRENL